MRARNIKPSLFKNEVLGTADPLLTILFEGLWCEADREGRLEDRPLRLKAEILPYRNDADIDAMLNWLAEHGFIARFEASTTKVIQVLKFSDHQRPHNNEVESVLPSMEAIKHSQGKKPAQPRKKALRSDSPSLIPDPGYLIPDTKSASRASLPEGLNLEAWERWHRYREDIRKPLKPASILAAQKQLAALGIEQASVVEQSIANGWQGLFPLKRGTNGTAKPAYVPPKSIEQLEAEERDRAQR